MKRFLRDIGLFIVLILVIAVIGDIIVSRGLRKTTIRQYAVWNDIYNGTNLDNDLVFIGASSCWAGFNPCVLDTMLGISAYNLGIDGHPWEPCQPLRYNTYMRYAKKKPNIVAIVIDEGSFDRTYQPYEREQFFPYLWIDDSIVTEVRECMDLTFLDRYCPMWRYIGYRERIEAGVASFFGKMYANDDGVYKGHRGNTWAWERASLTMMDSVLLPYDSEVAEAMLQFIEQRKEEGQNVLLVKVPIYHELQERFANKEEMCQRYDSIAREADVELIDYWNHPIVQDSIYFCNSTHLNRYGANIISAQLVHDLDSLNIIEQ